MSGRRPRGPAGSGRSGRGRLLVECADLRRRRGRARPRSPPRTLPGLVDCVAGARRPCSSGSEHHRGAAARSSAPPAPSAAGSAGAGGPIVTIDVVYDGEDLAEVGALTGLGAEGVVRAPHRAAVDRRLRRLRARLRLPRGRGPASTSRAAAPRAPPSPPARWPWPDGSPPSIPRSSPGGWQLIGRTAARMWDLDREDPALLRPGDRVRYRPVRELIGGRSPAAAGTAPGRGRPRGSRSSPPGRRPWSRTSAGRAPPRWASPPRAPLDARRRRTANRLVGNGPGAAVARAPARRARADAPTGEHVLAVTGAPAALTVTGPAAVAAPASAPPSPCATANGCASAPGRPARGSTGASAAGSRSRRCSAAAPPTRSPGSARTPWRRRRPAGRTATRAPPSGLPEPATRPGRGDAVGPRGPGPPRRLVHPRRRGRLLRRRSGTLTASLRPRRAPRLPGEPLERVRTDELPSEGVVPGCVQVPPSGLPSSCCRTTRSPAATR